MEEESKRGALRCSLLFVGLIPTLKGVVRGLLWVVSFLQFGADAHAAARTGLQLSFPVLKS